jgi:LysM repeat protein
MLHKTFTQVSVFILIVLAFLAVPISANAGGTCGSTYTVQLGDTLGNVAQMCGITVYELYNANPGISGNLYTGQVLTIPNGSNYNDDNGYNNNYNGYNNNPYNYNYAPTNSNGTYVVQVGDSFSEIANRFGVSMYALWNANPYIGNIELLYPGQVLNIPSASWATPAPASPYYASQPASPWSGSQPYSPWYGNYPPPPWFAVTPTPTPVPVPLSVGNVSSGAPTANIELSNKANAQVYVSLQGTARDGTNIIREYPVSGTFDKTIPAGFYYYVAWVGGQEFSGAINLPGGSNHSLIFHSNEVDVQ